MLSTRYQEELIALRKYCNQQGNFRIAMEEAARTIYGRRALHIRKPPKKVTARNKKLIALKSELEQVQADTNVKRAKLEQLYSRERYIKQQINLLS